MDETARLTLSFSERGEHPAGAAAALSGLLGLADAGPIERFLAGQREAPTPFSEPTSDLRRPLALRSRAEWDRLSVRTLVEEEVEVASRLGYN